MWSKLSRLRTQFISGEIYGSVSELFEATTYLLRSDESVHEVQGRHFGDFCPCYDVFSKQKRILSSFYDTQVICTYREARLDRAARSIEFKSTMIEKFQVLLPITTGKYELYDDRWCLKATSLCGLELLLNLFPTLTLDNLSFTSESLDKRKHPCKLPTLSHQFILLLRNISIKFTSSQSESSASNPALVK